MPTVSYGITNTNDDVCYIGGYAYNAPVVVGNEASYGADTYGGVLFRNLGVPKGATITSATLTLVRQGVNWDGTSWGRFYGVAQDNLSAWPNTIETTPLTNQYVNVKNDAIGVHDVTAIVQSIVNRPGWSASNNMAFVADPSTASGFITWIDFDDVPANSAKLSITYTLPETTTVSLSLTDTTQDGAGAANAPTTFTDNSLRSGDTLGTMYSAGWRFPGLTIPPTAVIVSAAFTPGFQSAPSGSAWGSIKAVNAANHATWAGSNNPYAVSKIATGAKALINAQTTYDMTDAVQAVIGLPGWASGNALSFATDPAGANGAYLFNGRDSVTKFDATLVVEYFVPPPTLADLSLSKSSVPANAPVGYVIANVVGQTPGSTLSLRPTEPRVSLVGTELRVAEALTQGNALFPEIDETLAGATNSPKSFVDMIEVGPPQIAEFVAALTGTTTPVLPAHQAGDMLICFMFRDGNTTAPALPAGWTAWLTAPGSACSYRLCYKIATSSAESGGAASTATTCITSVYRPAAGWALAAGSSLSGSTGTTATVTYPTLSLHKTDGTSFIGGAGGHRSTNTNIQTPPTGMVLRHNALDATDEAAMFDTDGGVSSWSNQSVSIGGTASGRMTVVFEIKGTYTPPSTSDRKPPRHSHWL